MIQYGSADILMRVIREEVRKQKLRIKDLAKLLKVSEPTAKRYLAGKGVTLEVWTKIYEVLGLNIRQVADRAGSIMVYQETFTTKQELTFCKIPGLYAFHYHLFNGYAAKEIMSKFKLTEKSTIFYLRTLDDISLIQWKTGFDFNISYSGEPNWQKNGPLAKKYREKQVNEFLFSKKSSKNIKLGNYLLTAEDLHIIREYATSALTMAWRAEQRTKNMKQGKISAWICVIADEHDGELENHIPNIK